MYTEAQKLYNREYKRHRRLVDPSFVLAEKMYRRRYSKRQYEFAKAGAQFARAYPDFFSRWLRGQTNTGSNTQAGLTTRVPRVGSQIVPAQSGAIPSAAALESQRLAAADLLLASLGIRRD
jgi:hypothetical protein